MVKAQLIDIGFKASLKAFFEGLAKKGVRIKRQINNFVHRHGKDFRPLDILQKGFKPGRAVNLPGIHIIKNNAQYFNDDGEYAFPVGFPHGLIFGKHIINFQFTYFFYNYGEFIVIQAAFFFRSVFHQKII